MEDFEDQVSAMMNYRTGNTAPFTAADITAGVRRRGRQRMFTVTGSALAVAAVGIGAVALAGTSAGGASAAPAGTGGGGPVPTTASPAAVQPTAGGTAATPSGAANRPHPASPVETLEAGQKLDLAPGYQIYVTLHAKCDVFSSPWLSMPNPGPVPQTVCKDVDGGDFVHDTANIAIQSSGSGPDYFLSGEYLGKTVPASIGVDYGGKHYTATILRTAGQQDWVAYYVRTAADVNAGHKGGTSVTAYDDDGKVLATTTMPMTVTAPPTTSPRK